MTKKWSFILATTFLLLLCFYIPTNTKAQTQSYTKTIFSTADSYVDSSNPDTNFGTQNRLNVSANNIQAYSYVKFDLSSLPTDASITNATLQAYWNEKTGSVYYSPSDKIGAYVCAENSWGEQSITWNNKPAIGSSPTSVWAITSMLMYHGYQSWDVTQDVKTALQSKGLTEVLKFSVKNGEDGFMVFQSKEGGYGAKIDIEYTSASQPTPTPVPPTPTTTSTPPTPTSTDPSITPTPNTPTSTAQPPTPTPTPIPEYTLIALIPLLISALLMALYLRSKKQSKRAEA
jgi:hypothetical protein